MRSAILFLALCGACAAHAQKIPDPQPFAKNITAAHLKEKLFVVAGADFEGRKTAR